MANPSQSREDLALRRIAQLLNSDYPATRRPANSPFNPAAFMSNVYASGALAPEGTAARLSQGSSATGEGGSPPDRDQAYRDALNTRFQGQNMDGTTFDRLPTDREAQALAASSFRNSGRQVMPRITTNSTFPGQVNPNVGTPTVRDPYGGSAKYGWQGRQTPQGNTTFRSATTDPRTGQTYITNFSVPGNAPTPQAGGMSPTVNPATGETVEKPEVRDAQQAFMDRIRYKPKKDGGGYMDSGSMADIYNSLPENATAATGSISYNPYKRAYVDSRGNELSPAQIYNKLQAGIYRRDMNKKNDLWDQIRANRHAQNAGFANVEQMNMFKDIMMAHANRGNHPFVNVQQGALPGQGAGLNGMPNKGGNAPLEIAPGGIPVDQAETLKRMRDSGGHNANTLTDFMRNSLHMNDDQIAQQLQILYPGENRHPKYGGEPAPFYEYVDGRGQLRARWFNPISTPADKAANPRLSRPASPDDVMPAPVMP